MSPFLVAKVLEGVIGKNFKAKKLASGDLLVEIETSHQSSALLALNCVSDYKVTVTPHKTLNTIQGVISEDDLLDASESEVVEGLSDQGVVVQRGPAPLKVAVATQTSFADARKPLQSPTPQLKLQLPGRSLSAAPKGQEQVGLGDCLPSTSAPPAGGGRGRGFPPRAQSLPKPARTASAQEAEPMEEGAEPSPPASDPDDLEWQVPKGKHKGYASSINSSASSKEVWDRVHKIEGSYRVFSVPLLNQNGVCPASLEEQANVLGGYHNSPAEARKGSYLCL
ncbi:hypothetical protein HPB47_025662 [Ixodes persulcatus]|uniref:Uncharacterized protein n=1 Tax=Ixodes persulcatus TaxID=34615 RepID=A0AC60Q0U4_IXOPE|nr:hypothetical protein HPB47_025662 [Ixodes persulcatus]